MTKIVSITQLNPSNKRTILKRSIFYGYYLKLSNMYYEYIDVRNDNRSIKNKTNGDNTKICKCKNTLRRKENYLYCSNCGFDNRVYLYCRRCKQHHSIKLNNKQNLCLDCNHIWERTIHDNRVIYKLSNSIFGLKYDIKRKYRKFLIQYYDKLSRYRMNRLSKKEERISKKVDRNRSKMDDLFCRVHSWRLQDKHTFNLFLKEIYNKKIMKTYNVDDFFHYSNRKAKLEKLMNKTTRKALSLDDLMNLEL